MKEAWQVAIGILLVCTGNTCRSAMGEALLRQEIARRGLADRITVSSAGTQAYPGDLASPGAMIVMAERDIDLTPHRARPLTAELVRQAALVLTMTKRQREAVLRMVPESADKAWLLREYAGQGDADILDPFGGGPEIYRACADDLSATIPGVIQRLQGESPAKE